MSRRRGLLSAARIKTDGATHPLPCGLATNIENDADDAGKKKKKKKKNARSTLSTGGGQRGKGGKRAWFYLSLSPRKGEIMWSKRKKSVEISLSLFAKEFLRADVQTDDGTQKCDIFYDSIYETCALRFIECLLFYVCILSLSRGARDDTRLSRSSIPTRYFIADDAWSTSKTARTRYLTRQRIVAFDPPIEHHFWGSNPCFLAFAPR